jgi:hypothetical protein
MDSETSPRAPPVERRILIIDGHALVRRGLSALIDGEPDLAVCAVAATRREGRAAVAAAGAATASPWSTTSARAVTPRRSWCSACTMRPVRSDAR